LSEEGSQITKKTISGGVLIITRWTTKSRSADCPLT
jgi:hypothetical protein